VSGIVHFLQYFIKSLLELLITDKVNTSHLLYYYITDIAMLYTKYLQNGRILLIIQSLYHKGLPIMTRIIVYYFTFINLLTFAAFGLDKRKAVKSRWRISEKTLLLMGLAGGSAGQIAGMKLFRHKTQKWYFRLCSILFAVLHIALLYVFFTHRK
jgi:uncharacterized membrane protein YsdA (DUF1294 family)